MKVIRRKTKSISYHASGRINYKALDGGLIYSEPIFEITKPFSFFLLSIPRIDKLDKYEQKLNKEDNFIEAPTEANARNNFELIIVPNNFILDRVKGFLMRYEGLFDIIIAINSIKIDASGKLANRFIYSHPKNGLFSKQKYSKTYSQLLFRQKLAGKQTVIIYPPNGKGVYKMYFAVPMRIAPKIKISFSDPNLKAVIIEDKSRTNTSAHFKVKDKHGFIKELRNIVQVELDAEL